MWSSWLTFFFISQSASYMLDKHPLNYGVYAPALRFVVGMCQIIMVGALAVTIYSKIGL